MNVSKRPALALSWTLNSELSILLLPSPDGLVCADGIFGAVSLLCWRLCQLTLLQLAPRLVAFLFARVQVTVNCQLYWQLCEPLALLAKSKLQ